MQYFVSTSLSTSLSIFHSNTQASVEDSTHQEGEEEGLIMAVEAQYPSPAVFRHARNDTTTSTLEDFHHQTTKLGGDANLLGGVYNNYNYNYNYVGQPHIIHGTVFSEPESELTCNISGSRKRFREDHHFNGNLASSQQQMLNEQQQLLQIQQQLMLSKWPPKEQFKDKSTSTSICTPSSLEDNRLNGSGGTSTSGRSSVIPSSYLVSSHSQDLNANLLRQNLEIDALILLQNEKLRSGVEETRKRQCRSLVSVLEQQVVKRLEEKETELANASRRNAELEEKIKQMNAENQIWFNVAKNNEAIASSLRTTLEQIVIQNQNQNEGQVKKEGFGDSSDVIIGGIVADDGQSCCNYVNDGEEDEENTTSTAALMAAEKTIRENRELKQRKSCKVCHQNEISVLLLPCRHLCLCKHCDTKFSSCPICNSLKNASLQVFIS